MLIGFVFTLALYSIAGSFIMKTNDFLSSLVFKVLPFFLGTATLVYVLKIWEVL